MRPISARSYSHSRKPAPSAQWEDDRGTNRGTAARDFSNGLGTTWDGLYGIVAKSCGEVLRSADPYRVWHAIIIRVSGVRIPPLASDFRQPRSVPLALSWAVRL